MRKSTNQARVEGRLFSHNLKERKVEKADSKLFGQSIISGTVDIATDDAGTNVVSVYYNFMTPTYSNGSENKTYSLLKKIIDTNKTWSNVGKENAMLVSANPSIAVNDFWTDNKEGEDVFYSVKRNENGFLSEVTKLRAENNRNTFTTDMYINEVKEVSTEDGDEYITLGGAVFSFSGRIMPLTYVVRDKAVMNYFIGEDISKTNPKFIKVSGHINFTTVTTKSNKDTSNIIGEVNIREYTNTRKEWEVTSVDTSADYEIDNEQDGITKVEIQQKMADREAYLATKKQEYLDRKNNKGATSAAAPSKEDFDF